MTETNGYAAARNTAAYHSRNAGLRQESRAYFAAIADGRPEPDDAFLPFWDALSNIAAGGSTAKVRKGMVDALTVLRSVVAEHGTVPDGRREYVAACTVTVTVHRDGRVILTPNYSNVIPDLRAQLDDEPDGPMAADVETITDHLISRED